MRDFDLDPLDELDPATDSCEPLLSKTTGRGEGSANEYSARAVTQSLAPPSNQGDLGALESCDDLPLYLQIPDPTDGVLRYEANPRNERIFDCKYFMLRIRRKLSQCATSIAAWEIVRIICRGYKAVAAADKLDSPNGQEQAHRARIHVGMWE